MKSDPSINWYDDLFSSSNFSPRRKLMPNMTTKKGTITARIQTGAKPARIGIPLPIAKANVAVHIPRMRPFRFSFSIASRDRTYTFITLLTSTGLLASKHESDRNCISPLSRRSFLHKPILAWTIPTDYRLIVEFVVLRELRQRLRGISSTVPSAYSDRHNPSLFAS